MKKGIVISGLPGSGKGVLAKKLAEGLGWKVFSIGDLWRKKYAESGKKVSFEEYWKSVDENSQRTMDEAARKIIEQGEVIGEFRFAKLAEGLECLFVFVTADLDVRAKRAKETGKYGDKDIDKIKEILIQREADEAAMGKQIYGMDYDYRDAGNYNILLDSGELSLNEEVKIVNGLLNGEELKKIINEIK